MTIRRGVPALAVALALAAPAGSGVARASPVVAQDLSESVIAACAGGAVIGALAAAGGGIGAAGATSGLFCGLSVAASLGAHAALLVWRHGWWAISTGFQP